jgi:hypothetical protein
VPPLLHHPERKRGTSPTLLITQTNLRRQERAPKKVPRSEPDWQGLDWRQSSLLTQRFAVRWAEVYSSRADDCDP